MINKKKNFFKYFLVFLCIPVYFFFLTSNKGAIKRDLKNTIIEPNVSEISSTKFTDVEYVSKNNKNQTFVTKAKKASILKENSDVINLSDVYSFTELKDKSLIKVFSKNGLFFKKTKNVFYSDNVKILNKDIIITSNEAKYYPAKNLIELDGDIIMKDNLNIVKSDIAKLNTQNNNLILLMKNNNERVHGSRNSKK